MKKIITLIVSAVCIICIVVAVAGVTIANSIALYFLFEGISNQLAEVKDGIIGLHNPGYNETKIFLANDKTSDREYINRSYVCGNFAIDTAKNAIKHKILCAYVELVYTDLSGHAIIAFNCTDRGLVYFEPQSDEIISPYIGQIYLEKTIAKIYCIW